MEKIIATYISGQAPHRRMSDQFGFMWREDGVQGSWECLDRPEWERRLFASTEEEDLSSAYFVAADGIVTPPQSQAS